jgi:photosystem II stability/assembly factor-like uncharacterized protein
MIRGLFLKRANWNHGMAWAAVFAIFGTGSVRAQSNAWTSVGPQGGEIQTLSADPHNPQRLYAATSYSNGLVSGDAFKSLDGGVHWVKSDVPNGPLIFDPQDPNTIYTFDSTNGISKSTDGGMSWNPANSGLPSCSTCSPARPVMVFALAIDPLNPSTLYAGTSEGIVKSVDGATSWSPANSGLPLGANPVLVNPGQYVVPVFPLIIDPQNPSTLYAVAHGSAVASGTGVTVYARGGMFKSTDGGGSWDRAGSGLPESAGGAGVEVQNLAIDPQNPMTLYAGGTNGIFKSTDGGTGWGPVNSGLPLFETGPSILVYSIVIDPQQPDTVYAAIGNLSGAKVFKTTNAGASWSDTSSGLAEGAFVSSLQIDLQNPTTLYAGTKAGVFKSNDGAATWAQSNSGLVATSISDVAIDPQNPGTLYAATSSGLVKTIDGGTNWNPAYSGLTGALSLLAIDPQNTKTVFAAGCMALSGCGVVKSTDGGATWTPSWIAQDFISDWITGLAIDPQNSDIVYMMSQAFDECGGETLNKSIDGGITWSHTVFKDLGVRASCILSLAIDPQNSGELYAAFQRGGVFKSTDAGATWHAANSGLTPGTPPSVFSAVALAIDPGSPSTVYTVSPQGVFKSTDGGMTWNGASSGLPDWSSGFGDCCFRPRLAVDPTDSARVYLGILAVDGAQHVFQSSDAGTSWKDSGLVVHGASGWFGGLAISTQQPGTVYAGSPSQGVFAFTNAVTAGTH